MEAEKKGKGKENNLFRHYGNKVFMHKVISIYIYTFAFRKG